MLGIYGREGVEAAAYWRNPPVGSPGWFAFTMHGNYDGKGGRFGGMAVPATVGDDDEVGAYAALDQGMLRVMLVNRSPDEAIGVGLDIKGFTRRPMPPGTCTRRPTSTASSPTRRRSTAPLTLPASSITVLELAPA